MSQSSTSCNHSADEGAEVTSVESLLREFAEEGSTTEGHRQPEKWVGENFSSYANLYSCLELTFSKNKSSAAS